MEFKGGQGNRELSLICQGRFVLLRHSVPRFYESKSRTSSAASHPIQSSLKESTQRVFVGAKPKPDESHWDFMLEQSDRLLTWRLGTLPEYAPQGPMQAIEARRIADHRPLYLDYEGEISGNRGSVRRVLGGRFEQLGWCSPRWTLRLVVDRKGSEQTADLHIDFTEVGAVTAMEFERWGFRLDGTDDEGEKE